MRHLVSFQWFAEAQSTTRSIRGTPKALFAFGLLIAAWPTSGQNLLLLREFPLYSNPARYRSRCHRRLHVAFDQPEHR